MSPKKKVIHGINISLLPEQKRALDELKIKSGAPLRFMISAAITAYIERSQGVEA